MDLQSAAATTPLWYGLVGAFLGLLCSAGALAPVLPWADASLPSCILSPLCALLWLALEIWLSRALHWDGLADLGDALGSAAEGEKFVKVLLDSRLGAFGVLLLLLVFLGQLLFLASLFYKALFLPGGRPLLLLPSLACAWSRLSPLWLARMEKARPGSFLGKILCEALDSRCFRLACLQALPCVFLSWLCGMSMAALVMLLILQLLLLRYLAGIAKRNGGLSGDYFGACIELSQLSFFACACFGTF